MPDFTYRELHECAAREVKQRERVYPRLIDQQRMTASFADRQIEMMREIAKRLAALVVKEEKRDRFQTTLEV